jgi:hypothetical protein
MSLLAFLNRVADEMGTPISLTPPLPSHASLPSPLHDLYSVTDGLHLPFAELETLAQIQSNAADRIFGDGWLAFGFDGYFTRYLVSTEENAVPAIAAFDPETDENPEPTYRNALELLEDEYKQYVENELHIADLHVAAIPPTASLPGLVQQLKRTSPLPSSDLLRQTRATPFVLKDVQAATGISVVRNLRSLGITASLQNVRPRSAG